MDLIKTCVNKAFCMFVLQFQALTSLLAKIQEKSDLIWMQELSCWSGGSTPSFFFSKFFTKLCIKDLNTGAPLPEVNPTSKPTGTGHLQGPCVTSKCFLQPINTQ